MNTFGRFFRVTIFGESHGEALGVVVDGVPAGMALSVADFEGDLARRQGGDGRNVSSTEPRMSTKGRCGTGEGDNADGGLISRMVGVTPRREADTPEIVSGVFKGHTTGAPLTVLFRNENTRSGDYAHLVDHPRPSHADLVAHRKFNGFNDPRGGGHFSGRVTLGLVAAGVVAKKVLSEGRNISSTGAGRSAESWGRKAKGDNADGSFISDVHISSEIIEIGGSRRPEEFEGVISAAMSEGDSVGGVVECRASGVPAGWGEPFFDSVESVAGHLLFSIPGVKGVEFGSGFEGSRRRGSENNDRITDERGTTATGNSGGIDGGITSGNEIVVRVAVKPTASISREQQTYNFATGRVEPLRIGGRHDACIALRAAVVVEAALAITLTDLKLTAI